MTPLSSLGLGARAIFKTSTLLAGKGNVDELMRARTAVFEEFFPPASIPRTPPS